MHLKQVTHSELSAFAAAVAEAMWNDEVMVFTAPYKDQYRLSFERHVVHRVSRRFYSGQFLFLVVSDSEDVDWTGKEVVMGYCCYSTTVTSVEKPHPGSLLGNAFERWAVNLWARYSQFFHLDKSADPAAERHFRKVCEKDMFVDYFARLPVQHRETKEDQHWELELLGTIPKYQRKGVGRFALQWGFEKARADAVPLIVLSSIAGEKLYANTGFKKIDRIDMLPANAEDAHGLSTSMRHRVETTDFGMGVGKGLSWGIMTWEPESLQRLTKEERASKT